MGSHTSTPDEEVRSVLDGVRRIVQSLRESSRWAERYVGMSGAQLFILQKLDESPAQSLNALAARTHTHQSSVSAIVTRLVNRGFVTRTRSIRDGRTIELGLSRSGKRLVDRAPDAAQERLIRGIRQLPPARRRTLASTLAELGRAMDTADGRPAMFFEEHRPSSRRSVRRA